MKELDLLEENYKKIINDELGVQAKVVFGGGNTSARVMLIGEAPGEKEEELGKPFVGTAGKNLNEFLEILKLEREDIYITNVVKIRPFKVNPKTNRKSNRPPTSKEVEVSIGTLKEQINIIKPEVVVTLGNVSLKAVLGDNSAKIGDYHGKPVDMDKYKLFPLYHPASIIYNRALYTTYIEDVHKLKKYIESI
jgi:DNA polymerase